MNKIHILVVDDDAEIRSLLSDILKTHHYEVSIAADGEELFQSLNTKSIDLILLDIMLPGEDGFALCKKIRQSNKIPIIMLTAASDAADRIVGLELGADDYLAKPFNPRELVARIKSVLRRLQNCDHIDESNVHANTLKFSGWVLDIDARRLFNKEGVEVLLTSGEYELLVAFLEHPRKVLSRDQLMDKTRHRDLGPFDRTIDVQISRLRHKIEPDPKNPTFIKTVRNGGYLFTADINR